LGELTRFESEALGGSERPAMDGRAGRGLEDLYRLARDGYN
jgi:hypothetical protein